MYYCKTSYHQNLKNHIDMQDLFFAANELNQTPLVDFKVSGELRIEGKSFPENPIKFYEPILDWVKEFKATCPKMVSLTLKLEYFNTSTSKLILHMLKFIEGFKKNGTSKINIVWYYYKTDEEMLESGKDYKSIIDLPFELVEYE